VLKSHNKWLVLGVALLILIAVSQIGFAANEPPVTLFINPNPSPEFKADVWVDKGQGATYYPGDSIDVYYSSNKDSYVYILNIDAANRSRWAGFRVNGFATTMRRPIERMCFLTCRWKLLPAQSTW